MTLTEPIDNTLVKKIIIIECKQTCVLNIKRKKRIKRLHCSITHTHTQSLIWFKLALIWHKLKKCKTGIFGPLFLFGIINIINYIKLILFCNITLKPSY